MGTLAHEVKRAEANGHVQVAGFTGAVKSVDFVGFEKGEVFTFPLDFTGRIYEQKLGTYTVQYVFVDCANGESKPFYPSTFTKSRQPVNPDLTPKGGRVKTEGNVAEEFRKHATVGEAMAVLAGKKCVITDVAEYTIKAYGKNETQQTQILTIDFAK